jgi:hypothetical protein
MSEHIAPAFEGVASREMGLQHASGACAHCGGALNVARKLNQRLGQSAARVRAPIAADWRGLAGHSSRTAAAACETCAEPDYRLMLLLRCSSRLRFPFRGGPFCGHRGSSRLQLNVNWIWLQLATWTFRSHGHGHRLVAGHDDCDNKVSPGRHREFTRRLAGGSL